MSKEIKRLYVFRGRHGKIAKACLTHNEAKSKLAREDWKFMACQDGYIPLIEGRNVYGVSR